MSKPVNPPPEPTPEWPRAEPRDQGGFGTARGRTLMLSVMFCAGFVALSARAVQIGLFRPVDEAATAARADATPPSKRADIVDRNGQLLATSLVAHNDKSSGGSNKENEEHRKIDFGFEGFGLNKLN